MVPDLGWKILCQHVVRMKQKPHITASESCSGLAIERENTYNWGRRWSGSGSRSRASASAWRRRRCLCIRSMLLAYCLVWRHRYRRHLSWSLKTKTYRRGWRYRWGRWRGRTRTNAVLITCDQVVTAWRDIRVH